MLLEMDKYSIIFSNIVIELGVFRKINKHIS
jgi:hypothetical protein